MTVPPVQSPQPNSPARGTRTGVLWALLLASYAAAFTTNLELGFLTLLIAWLPVAFAALHLTTWVGWRTAAVVFAIIAVVSYTWEALGVATGLVFGNYYYPDGPLGPLLLGVPPLIQLQYFAMGYACLITSRAIAGVLWQPARGWLLAAVSAMGAFGMTVLDLSSDPMQSTVRGDWVWRDGGAFFGVPVHNFAGWFVVTATFFLLVNLVLTKPEPSERLQRRRVTGFYLQGVLLFGSFPFAVIVHAALGDHSAIAQAMAAVAAFAVLPVMLAALLALARSSTGPATQQ